MNLKDIYENISAQQKSVRQLPADFKPANTSPQLSGPYPGRNATRGYLVGEASDQDLDEELQHLPFGTVNVVTPAEHRAKRQKFVDDLIADGVPEKTAYEVLDFVRQEVSRGVDWDTAVEVAIDRYGIDDPYRLEREKEREQAYTADQARVRQQTIKTLQNFYKQARQREGQERAQAIALLRRHWSQATPEQKAELERQFGADPRWQEIMRKVEQQPRRSEVDNLREQNTASGRRTPRVGDTIEWSTMRDRSPQTGRVLDIKGLTATVLPTGEQDPSRAIRLQLGNKSLSYKVIQTPPPPARPTTSTQTSAPVAGVTEIRNPLDDERRQQRAYDREREQFRRDELEFELGGEETDSGPAYYVKINNRDAMRDQQGQPRKFPSYNAAAQMAMRYKMKYPDRKAEVVNIFFDEPMTESRDSTYEDVLSSLQKKLGDYLQDVATAVKKDSDLLDRVPDTAQDIQAVKTITTDDGHEIKIHGNEDDGFRISIKNQDIRSQFRDLDEAVMACEMYCAQRRKKMQEQDYLPEKKDACYHKVKSRYKVWPSAYASGALVQCRKKGASNWGDKS